jgi:P-type E1-E2 ATPase
LLDEAGINNPYKSDELRLSQNGNSIVYVADEKEVLAVIGVNDIIRDNAKSVISELKSLGAEPIMLTGDNEKTAKKLLTNLE